MFDMLFGIVDLVGDAMGIEDNPKPQKTYKNLKEKWMEEGKTARMREWNNWYMPRIQFYDRCILINELSKEEDNGYDRSKIKIRKLNEAELPEYYNIDAEDILKIIEDTDPMKKG